jgi:hypothetical protein
MRSSAAAIVRAAASSVAFILTTQGSAAQDAPEHSILRRAVAASQKAVPEWQYIPAIWNSPPLLDEELGVAAGLWRRQSDTTAPVNVSVHAIASAGAAARWLNRRVHGELAKG